MDFGAAFQTQRIAMLRLIAGWLAVLALLSLAPVAPGWTRRMRWYLFAVLRRAEAAGQCLLAIQARTLLDRRGGGGPASLAHLRSQLDVAVTVARALENGEPPSLAELRARFLALRCLLNDLPRRGLRLLRRLSPRRGPCGTWCADRTARHLAEDQCPPPSFWHPPEPACPAVSIP